MLKQMVHIFTTVTSGSYSAHGCRFVASTSPNDAMFRQGSVVEWEAKYQVMCCEVQYIYWRSELDCGVGLSTARDRHDARLNLIQNALRRYCY